MHLHLNRSFACGFTTKILYSYTNWEILTSIFVIVTIILFLNANYGLSKLPPGPLRWPVIGNLGHVIVSNPRKTLRHLRQSYGDVFRLYLGKQLFVVVNGYDVLHETMVKKPYDWSNNLLIIPSVSNRKDLYHRIYSTSKSRIHDQAKHVESTVECQVKTFISELSKVVRIHIDIHQQLLPYLAKALCSLTETFPSIDGSDLDVVQENEFDSTELSAILRLYDFCLTTKLSLKARITEKFCHKLTNQNIKCEGSFHRKNRQYGTGRLRRCSDNDVLPTTDDGMSRIIAFSAFSLCWSVLYLVHDKHLQGKLRQEVISVVGKTRYPCKKDLKHLPLCQSFLLEAIRHSNILPFSVTHRTFKDTSFRGFWIPEGTIILLNTDSVLNDNNIFSNPREFKPDRFIGKYGEFVPNDKLTSLITGNMHSLDGDEVQISMLVFLSTLIQRFELLATTDNKNVHSYTEDIENMGLIYDTKRFKIRTREVL